MDHPYTLTSRNNLAQAYELDGSLDEAIWLYKKNVAEAAHISTITLIFSVFGTILPMRTRPLGGRRGNPRTGIDLNRDCPNLGG